MLRGIGSGSDRGAGGLVSRLCALAVVLAAGLTFACAELSDVKSVRVTEENKATLYERIQDGSDLTGEEVRLLDAYLERQGFDGELAVGKTVGEMIAEQRGFEGRGEATAAVAEGSAAARDDAPAAAMDEAPAAPPAPADRPSSASQPAPAPRAANAETAPPAPAPEAAVVPPTAPPAPATRTLPASTSLEVRLEQTLSSKTASPGDRFEASLTQDLMVDGKLLAPRGSRVVGKIPHVQAAGKVKGLAQMSLSLERLIVRDEGYAIETNTLAFEARPTKGQDAKKIGIGAGAGAVIGAIAGGKKGAAIGAAVGGAGGTAVVLATSGDEVELPAEQALSFELASGVEMRVLGR